MIKKNGKKRLCLLLTLSIILITTNVYSHSGRTDANGGHKDNQNKSGLGSYHYHCGGHPAHLHTNGSCPYSSSSSSGSSSSSTSSSAASSTKTTTVPASTTPVQPKTSAPKTISTTGIKINESIETMEKGSTQKLTATITPSNATNKNVSWKSSNNEIATVNSSGEVTAVKTGTVDIIAVSSNGLVNSISIAVTQQPTGIQINETIEKIEVGNKQQLTATILPEDATDKNIVWSSSDNGIASISATGEIVAIKSGTVDIMATTSNGVKTNLKLLILQPPTEIKINENIKELEIDESKVLTAIVNPSDAFDKTVEWQSSDNEILTIDKEGKITAKKAGKAIIAVTSVNGLNDSIEIIVKEPKQIENTIQSSEGTTTTDTISGLLGLGTLGGGYWLYKKNKNNK